MMNSLIDTFRNSTNHFILCHYDWKTVSIYQLSYNVVVVSKHILLFPPSIILAFFCRFLFNINRCFHPGRLVGQAKGQGSELPPQIRGFRSSRTIISCETCGIIIAFWSDRGASYAELTSCFLCWNCGGDGTIFGHLLVEKICWLIWGHVVSRNETGIYAFPKSFPAQMCIPWGTSDLLNEWCQYVMIN